MRVIFLGTRGFPNVQGGVEKHCENLAVNLAGLGYEVIVFTRKPYVDTSIKEYKGVKLIAVPTVRNKYIEALMHTFLGIIQAYKYRADIIHIHGIGPGVLIPFGKMLGLKFVLTTHGSNYKHLKWGRIGKHFLKLCEYISVNSCDELIAVSEDIAQEIKKRYKRIPYIIPNGVQLLEPIESKEKLKELDIKQRKYILTVGRLVPEKGFHNLISAFDELALKDWKLVIVGSADHKSKYSEHLLEMSASNKDIIFTGFLSGIPLYELFENAGLFVLPSYYEGHPIALLEAMSFDVPCIASDIPANRSIGLPDECYFNLENNKDLKEKIVNFINLCQDTEKKYKFRENLMKKYNWSIITENTHKVYKQIKPDSISELLLH